MTAIDTLIKVAEAQLGYREGRDNHTKFGEWYAKLVKVSAVHTHLPRGGITGDWTNAPLASRALSNTICWSVGVSFVNVTR